MKRSLGRTLVVLIGCTVVSITLGARDDDQSLTADARRAVITRSSAWSPSDIPAMNLTLGPQGPGAFAPGATVQCEYVDKRLSGASPKFACRLPDGDELKVKYGGTNGEVYSEVAASRLLWALGFGADHMYPVRVVCRSCPPHIGNVRRANGDRIVDPATVERKMPGEELLDQWKWDELERIDVSAGGATKAERDAFTLLAVFLQHSDSKPDQHRVVCVEGSTNEGGLCRRPLIMINDLGVTFGRATALHQQRHASMNLVEWAKVPIWKNADRCVGNVSGSLKGTLKNPVISEEGRRFLAGLLVQLSDIQIRDLFEVARVQLRLRSPGDVDSGLATVEEWVDTFRRKRQEILGRRCT